MKTKKAPKKVHTNPWALYGALKSPGSAQKLPAAPEPGAPAPSKEARSSPPPAPSLEKDATAALSEATRANPPKQWDQPGGPPAPVAAQGAGSKNPPSTVDRADRPFSAQELARVSRDARAAITKGAPRAAVEKRLKENGLDPKAVLNG